MSGAAPDPGSARGGAIRRLLDHDLVYSFLRSPLTVVAAAVTGVIFIATGLAPWLAPHEPFNPATLSLMDAFTVPAWMDGGTPRFLLGADDLGHDVLSTIMHGARISIVVGFSAVMLGMTLGVGLGVLSGYLGGWFEIVVMRLADIQLTIPGILVALLIDGVARYGNSHTGATAFTPTLSPAPFGSILTLSLSKGEGVYGWFFSCLLEHLYPSIESLSAIQLDWMML